MQVVKTIGLDIAQSVFQVHGLVASVNKAPYVSAKFGLVGLSRVASAQIITCSLDPAPAASGEIR
jgi:hypothetical protein